MKKSEIDIKAIEARLSEIRNKAKKDQLTKEEKEEAKKCLKGILQFYHPRA